MKKIRWISAHFKQIMKILIFSFVLVSLFLPWYYDYAERDNKMYTIDWYLQWYVDNNEIKFYSIDTLPNIWYTCNVIFYAIICVVCLFVISFILHRITKKDGKIEFFIELTIFLIIFSILSYFYASYPYALAEDGKHFDHPCLIQHSAADTVTFIAKLRYGVGGWGPSYGWFIMLSAFILLMFLLEYRIRLFLGRKYLIMREEAPKIKEILKEKYI